MATKRKGKGGLGVPGADPAFVERNADFNAAWAERQERGVAPPAPASVLHRHTEACWVDRNGEPVPTETRWLHSAWLEGRVCQQQQVFIAERWGQHHHAVTR